MLTQDVKFSQGSIWYKESMTDSMKGGNRGK